MSGAFSIPTHDNLVNLIYQESRLLDSGRYEEWYELYSDDALYWLPLAPDQEDGLNAPSLMYEDKMLLRLRLERLSGPRAHSLHPAVRCLHVLQRPEVVRYQPEIGDYALSTPFIYVETQGQVQHMLGATAYHTVLDTPAGLRIQSKKVVLLNCDAPLPALQLFP